MWMPWEHTVNPHNWWVPGSCGLLPKGALWFSFTPADSNSDSKWQCLSDLCHLASAQRTKGGCVIGMLMPTVTSVPPSLSQTRNVVRQLCVQKTHRSGEARHSSEGLPVPGSSQEPSSLHRTCFRHTLRGIWWLLSHCNFKNLLVSVYFYINIFPTHFCPF